MSNSQAWLSVLLHGDISDLIVQTDEGVKTYNLDDDEILRFDIEGDDLFITGLYDEKHIVFKHKCAEILGATFSSV